MRKNSFSRSDERSSSNNQLALVSEQENNGIDGVPQLTKKFYDAISQHSVNTNSRVIEGTITIFQNIITNPYDDKARIADYLHYNQSKLFSYPSCLQYLRDLGFVEGKKDKQLLFPYDMPIAKLIRAKEALGKIHEEKIEEIQLLDVEQKTVFPYFQQYCQLLDSNLIMKHTKNERQRLQVSMDETLKIYEATKASSLEEMIVEFMSDPKGFQDLVYSSFVSQPKAREFIKILTELWLEANVLRKFAIYIIQCFSDSISRAEIHLPHDHNSKIARQILMIDLLHAQGIVKHSQKQIKSIEDIVRVFLIRNRLETEDNARIFLRKWVEF